MNNLSWLIYLSNILPNLQTGINVVSGVVIIAMVVWGIIYMMCRDDPSIRGPAKPKWKYGVFGLVGLTIGCLLPSSETIRLIAASEFGERIVNSERVQGIVDPGLKYVEQWLKNQLKKER